jgi:hypothetical protein
MEMKNKELQQNKRFTALTDEEVPADLRPTLAKWRGYAGEFPYDGPVAWRMPAGYTLKQSAPKDGPCDGDFQNLQQWDFNDEPTKVGIVFWIPRTIRGSKMKTAEEQINLLANLRKQHGLPEHHLIDFGSPAIIAGLIFAHFNRTGDRVPPNPDYVRTSTRYSGGDLLCLGEFGGHGLLSSDLWYDFGGNYSLICSDSWYDDRGGNLGVFPLGVEIGY